MNVLVVMPHYVPAYQFGGPVHAVHALSVALMRQGHRVKVCTTRMATAEEDLDVPIGQPVDVDGVEVHYERVVGLRYWGFSPWLLRRIWKEVAWADVVLVHFHYQFASLAGSWAARARGRPFVVFTHGSLRQSGIERSRPWLKRLYLRLLEGSNFRRALFVAYHSEEELGDSLQPGRSVVVPNGIDPQAFAAETTGPGLAERYPETRRRLIYLYLGRLHAGKGLDILLPALRMLLDHRRDVHLLVAGGDERGYEVEVQRMVRELGIGEHVTLTGRLEGDAKRAALRDADVYVLPSRSEGLSVAMLEAMYAGLPVVVTDRVGLWRTIREEGCGIVVPPDPLQLSQALESLADSDRVAMGARARALVERHHLWQGIATDLVERIRTAR